MVGDSLGRGGIERSFVEGEEGGKVEEGMEGNRKGILIESLGNGKWRVVEMGGIGEIGEGDEIGLVIEKRFGSGYVVGGIEDGGEMVIDCGRKFMGGEGR